MFCKFFHSFSMSISFSFVLLKVEFHSLCVQLSYASSFSNLTFKNSSGFNWVILLLLFDHRGGKFTSARNTVTVTTHFIASVDSNVSNYL